MTAKRKTKQVKAKTEYVGTTKVVPLESAIPPPETTPYPNAVDSPTKAPFTVNFNQENGYYHFSFAFHGV